MVKPVPKVFAPKQKTRTQQILNKTRFVSKRADGTLRIVRDSYHNTDQTWWAMQKRVCSRDSNQCRAVTVDSSGARVRCTHSKPDYKLHCHHVKPLSKGGKTIIANLILLCEDCHHKRHKHDF